jgi:hypothetical protein
MFKRLLTYLAQNAVCASHFAVHNKSAATILSTPNNDHLNTSHVSEGATCSFLNVSLSSTGGLLLGKENATSFGEANNNELHVKDEHEFEDDFVVDDDMFPNGHADDQDNSESDNEECQADHSVLNLLEKLFRLRSIPLGLERFSREDKVRIELLQLLRDLVNCPLKACTLVLNRAGKSNASGHVFQEGCLPTHS